MRKIFLFMAAIISAFAISAQTQTIVIQGPNGKLMADLSVPSLNTNEKKNCGNSYAWFW